MISTFKTSKEKGMPLFEYRCKECGHVTEFLEKADSRGRHACDACGSARTEKIFSTFSAQSAQPTACADGQCPAGDCATCPGGLCAPD